MTFKHQPSHLDIESPQFENVPHIRIQWKGTDVDAPIRKIIPHRLPLWAKESA